jgi:hydroxyacylglutathione hydrolase
LVIDPSEAAPISAVLESRGLRLSTVLLTHHHLDHVGGLPALLARYGKLAVYAHAKDGSRIASGPRSVEDGQRLDVGFGQIEVLHVPGHTLGGVAYVWQDAVFTGDTLFGAGCGRIFEGTATQMYGSLCRLAALPKAHWIYSGHEYTLQNLAFAAVVEPENTDVQQRIELVRAERTAGSPSVPSTMEEELLTNPFLRCDAEQFVELRHRKDGFVA